MGLSYNRVKKFAEDEGISFARAFSEVEKASVGLPSSYAWTDAAREASAASRASGNKVERMEVSAIPDRAKAIGMPKEKFDILASSIKAEGVKVPLIVDIKTGRVIDGQHRAMVADYLKIKDVPVVRIDESKWDNDSIDKLSFNLNKRYS